MYHKIVFTKFKENFVYRVDVIGGIINSFIELVALWFVWNAIFASSGVLTIKGITLPAMITYISISTVIRIYSHSYTEYMIHDDVKHGGIVVAITKPINYIFFVLSRELGITFFRFIARGIPILLVAFIVLGAGLPLSPIFFFISFILGFFINFFLVLLIGLWSFWAGNIWGLRLSKNVISDISSGAIFPLFLFPQWFQQIAYLLPFQAIYNIPLSIYIGQISGFEIYTFLLIQVFWFLSLGLIALIVWKFAQKKIFVQGG
ncbi:MAG: hypothetical protein GTN40_00990 [Candidatus Aenigmarchaeota archaeon]|nr:hypothetical protein [Candidatus Aenigmarchaeota archaeon]